LVGLRIEIHLVFTFLSNFKPLVSMMLAKFVNSKWHLGLCKKFNTRIGTMFPLNTLKENKTMYE
jgi:hypothetical protein